MQNADTRMVVSVVTCTRRFWLCRRLFNLPLLDHVAPPSLLSDASKPTPHIQHELAIHKEPTPQYRYIVRRSRFVVAVVLAR
jgi:hypothetical protein